MTPDKAFAPQPSAPAASPAAPPGPGAAPTLADGFAPHFRKSPLTAPWEPLYSRRTAQAVQIGLHIREAHCNSRGFVHGGLISALAFVDCVVLADGALLARANATFRLG